MTWYQADYNRTRTCTALQLADIPTGKAQHVGIAAAGDVRWSEPLDLPDGRIFATWLTPMRSASEVCRYQAWVGLDVWWPNTAANMHVHSGVTRRQGSHNSVMWPMHLDVEVGLHEVF
jgi:hypothetical protein